jgi:photosystem II stability/assembly factor-like uncharacterized protein
MKEMPLIVRAIPAARPSARAGRASRAVLTTLVALAIAVLAAGCAAMSSAPQAAGTSTLGTASGTPAAQPAGGTASAAASSPVPSASCVEATPASSNQAPALSAVQFVDPGHGWVVGAGRILATSDGGRTWTRQYGGSADLGQVDFIDSRHGWAVGGDTLLRTTDGGGTWAPLAEPCQAGLVSVHFVSPGLGYAVAVGSRADLASGGLFTSATGGTLLRTTDGGVTWATVASAPENPQTACFANTSDGYLGTPGHIWRSTDGGRNWTLALTEPRPSSPGDQARILDTAEIECAGQNAVWVLFLGEGAAMEHAPYLAYASQDGREWHAVFEEQYTESGLRPGLKLPEGPGSYPGPFSAIDSGTAAFVGYTPPVGYGIAPLELVSNRGYTLTREGNVAAINEPFATAFLSSAQGWVVGENLRTRVFSIQATTNSGRTWTTQYTIH